MRMPYQRMSLLSLRYSLKKSRVNWIQSKVNIKCLSVRGRLKEHLRFWEQIEAPQFILDTIRSWYKIPFLVVPPYTFKQNNSSALLHSDFVSEAIKKLLAGDRISEVNYRADIHTVNPPSVTVQSSGKKRLILD
jgi:hypothetical protein